MAFLPEVGTYLVANVTAQTLVLGTNLFLGRMPETPDICVAIIETSGQSAVDAMGGSSLPAYTRPRAQVLVRAASYSDASALAEDIYKQMQKIDNESLSGVYYLRANGMQSPFYLERDPQERAVFSCNYQTLRVLT